jgi:hypothetical protein
MIFCVLTSVRVSESCNQTDLMEMVEDNSVFGLHYICTQQEWPEFMSNSCASAELFRDRLLETSKIQQRSCFPSPEKD